MTKPSCHTKLNQERKSLKRLNIFVKTLLRGKSMFNFNPTFNVFLLKAKHVSESSERQHVIFLTCIVKMGIRASDRANQKN